MVKVEEKAEESVTGPASQGPMSSLSSEGSFVILETFASPESQELPSIHHPLALSYAQNLDANSLNCTDVQNSIMQASSVSDLSSEEIQKKLQKLVQENLELKDTLHQNNLAMTQQFNTLLMWREEVVKVQQSHKEKFAETKEYILKLQAENKELKKFLEESRRGSLEESELKAENVSLKGKVAELQQKLTTSRREVDGPNRKERELDELVGQLNRQLESAERAKRQLTMENEKLTAQKTRLERELEEQASTVRQLVVERGREREKLPVVESTTETSHLLSGADKGDFGSSLKGYGKHLDEINCDLDKEAERLVSLDSWLQVAAENVCRWHGKDTVEQQTVAQLQQEVKELRRALIDEQAFGSKKGVRLEEAQKQLQKLFSDYQELLQEWEKHDLLTRDRAEKENSRYEQQILEMKRAMETMAAEKIQAEQELILQYEEKLKTLSSRVKTLEAENEAITILRTQVELFRADFDAERESRGNLASEKEQLVSDLRILQKRNEELLAQIQSEGSSTPRGWFTLPSQRNQPQSQNPPSQPQTQTPTREERQRMYDEPVPSPQKYYCPICNLEFKQLDILNHHIESCLTN